MKESIRDQYVQKLFSFTNASHHDVYPFLNPKGPILENSAAGKTVLVTGSTGGIGKATALAFASVGAAKVIITGRTTTVLEELKSLIESTTNTKALVFTLDISKEDEITKMFKSLVAGNNIPDILVNNAGRMETAKPLADLETSDFWATFEINTKGVYMMAKAFINANKSRGGTIINTSSVGAGLLTPYIAAYQTSKSDVQRLTEFMHLEYDDKGFRCFSFHPGGVATKLATAEGVPQAVLDNLIDSPELAGMVAVYLATNRSDYLKGRYVGANWDLEELEQRKEEILSKDLFKMRIVLGAEKF